MFCSEVSAEEDEGDEEAEKAFLQLSVNVPAGPPLSLVLRDPEKRRKLGEFMEYVYIKHRYTAVSGQCVRE